MYKFYYTNGYGVTSYIRKPITSLWQNAWNPDIRKWLMRINLTCLILLIAFMQVSLAANAQKISLSKKNAPLTEIFKELRKQSGYDFVINKDQIKIAKPVTILVNGDDLINVLNRCFEGQPFTYSVEDKMIIVVNKKAEQVKIFALPLDVKGQLVDEKGVPMMGASVSIKGTERKTITNQNGEFSFTNVDEKSMIIISFVGYEPKELLVKVDLGIIRMTIITEKLDEVNVVSTGYQKLDKARSTGSYVKITSEMLNQQIGKNILTRLEAIGNGLNVDRATNTKGTIMIRGLSTIRGPKEPLIILDDFAYAGDISNINPDDVESITILKDAAAASIWGARAGNGVIVITTKKSKINTPLTIDFNTAVSVINKPNLGYAQRMSSADFLGIEEFLYKKGYYASQINSAQKPPLTPFVELLILNANGQLSNQDLANSRNQLSSNDVYQDFDRLIYQRGLNQQYSLRLSGGGERNIWSLSSGYNRNTSNLNAIDERSTLRLSNTYQFNKNLTFSSIFTYAGSKSVLGKQGVGEILSYTGIYPYARFADDLGNPLPIIKSYRQTFLSSTATQKLLDWSYYPLLDYQNTENTTGLDDLVANFDLSYKLPFGFKASLKYSIEQQKTSTKILNDQNSYYTRNYINSFTQVNSTSGAVTYPVPLGSILDKSESTLRSNQYRGQLDYDRSWNDHQFTAFGGFEWRRAINEGSKNRVYGYDVDKLNTGLVDYTRTYPNFITGSTNYIQNGDVFNLTANNFFSQFANLSYSFKNTYTLSASARADASNLFGISTNNRWKPLWSVGFGWDISKMSFFKFENLDLVKLRATYGFSGNIDPSMVGVNTIRYQSTSAFTGTPTATFDKFSNPDLRWENVGMLNLGADFSLFKGRLSGSIEYYEKNAKDLFGIYPIDYTIGIGPTVVKNVAEIKGQGMDFLINSQNSVGKFKWSSTLNFSLNKERVIKYYLPSTDGSSFVYNSASVTGVEGLPVYSIFSYKFAGLDPQTGDPMGFVNGVPSKDYLLLTGSGTKVTDLKNHGSALPKYFGSFINNFNYMGFTLALSLNFKFDYYFRRRSIDYGSMFSTWEGHQDFAQRWQKPGDELVTNVPSVVYPNPSSRDLFYKFSDILVEKGDYIKIQYINLNYSLPNKIISSLKLKGVDLYANVSNLGILYSANKLNIDPEYSTNSFNLPPGKTFSFGLRTTF